jgi:hypothetical protein
MNPTRHRWRYLLPGLLGIVACASGSTGPPSPAEIAGTQAKTIVVAPFNVALALPDGLKSSIPLASDTLTRVLEKQDKTVRLLSDSEGKALWIESALEVAKSGGPKNFESAVRVFASKLQRIAPFDAMIVPSLYIQNASATPVAARWDRANQQIEFIGRAREEIEMPAVTTIPAASVLMYVTDRDGEVIHTKRTGIELLQHMEVRIKRKQGYDQRIWTLTDDDPPIESEVRMRAAIAHALHPFLPK